MITSESVEKTLRNLVVKVDKDLPRGFGPDQRFREDLGADSLDLVVLLHEIEDEFDITISDEQGQQIRTLRDAVSFVVQEVKKQ